MKTPQCRTVYGLGADRANGPPEDFRKRLTGFARRIMLLQEEIEMGAPMA